VDECKPLHKGGHRVQHYHHEGRAVQVDPIRPNLELPGAKHLKLNCDEALSNFAFKFNLRRYTKERDYTLSAFEAGAYTSPLFGSTSALFCGIGGAF